MPFIKHIPPPCFSREHNPPKFTSLQPGTHVWKCTECGAEQSIVIGANEAYAELAAIERQRQMQKERTPTFGSRHGKVHSVDPLTPGGGDPT